MDIGTDEIARALSRPTHRAQARITIRTALVAALAALFLAAPAAATTATLKRSIENLTQWPLDIAASPVVAGETIVNNLQNIEDSPGVRIAYPVPGYVWNLMVQAGAGVLRGITGALEFVPGVVLLFTDQDLDPMFDPVEENEALVDYDNDYYRIKFGVDYTSTGY